MVRFRPVFVPLLVAIKNPQSLDSHASGDVPAPLLQCLKKRFHLFGVGFLIQQCRDGSSVGLDLGFFVSVH